MTAGTHISNLELRKQVQDKRDSCGNYNKHSGGCSVRRALYCYKCKNEWIPTIDKKKIYIPYIMDANKLMT